MSVFVISDRQLNEIYNKAISYKNNGVCDINYCYILSEMYPASIDDWIRKLYELNLKSYNRRYKRRNKVQFFVDALELKQHQRPNISTYQMLKFLECLRYNIEVNETHKAVRLLDRVIADIQSTIIGQMPEYDNADWSID